MFNCEAGLSFEHAETLLIPKNDSSKIRNVFKNIPHMINSKPQTHVECSYRFSDRTAS